MSFDRPPSRTLRRAGLPEAGPRAARLRGGTLALFLPGFSIYAAFVLYPLAATAWVSLHTWTGLGPAEWAGAANYGRLVRDPLFWRALENNLLFLPFYVVLPAVLGMLLAVLLATRGVRARNTYRVLLFLPQVMPMAVLGVIWRWMLNPVFGPVNAGLRAAGLETWAQPWLGSFTWALPSVGLVATWVYYGFCMVLFLAGIQRADPDLYDAARIDGATRWDEFRHVTWPAVRPETAVALLFTGIAALKVFDLVFVMTRGGPGNRTLVMALYLYRTVFERNEVGYGAAIAVALTLLVLMASVALRRLSSEVA